MTDTAMLGDDLEIGLMPALGLLPGTVVSNDDPDKGGRLRIRVDALHGRDDEAEKIPDDALPWARPCFPVSGNKEGEAWVPEPGALLWVAFWGGEREKPVWLGGWFPTAQIPPEFSSSYMNGPKTRFIKAGGHTFEMRWKEGQEHIYFKSKKGVLLDIVDADALGGPKIVGKTPGNRTFYVDDKLQRAGIETPTQKAILDDAAAKISVTTPGTIDAVAAVEAKVTVGATILDLTPAQTTLTTPIANIVTSGATNVQAGGVVSVQGTAVALASTSPGGTATTTAAGLSTGSFTGAQTLTFLAAVTWALAGLFTISGAGAILFNMIGTLSFFGSQVLLGQALATKFSLLTAQFYTFITTHTHQDSLAAPTSPPNGPIPPLNTVSTQHTFAS